MTKKSNGKQEIEIRAELDERPEMTVVVAEVQFNAPLFPPSERKRVKEFIQALLTAYRARATSERNLVVVEEGEKAVVIRKLADVEDEIRFTRISPTKAIMHCDKRELENLQALGILDSAKVKKQK